MEEQGTRKYQVNDKSLVIIEGWMINAGIPASAPLVVLGKVYGMHKKYGGGVSEFAILQLFGADFSGSPEDIERKKKAFQSIKWLIEQGIIEEKIEKKENGFDKKVYYFVEGSLYIPEGCR